MIDLRGYNIHEQIYKTDIMEIYRGYSINDKKPVIIKAINGEAPISTDVSKIMHEYGITRNLNIDGIIKPFKLEQSEQGLALITEDIQAESLRKYILNNTISIYEFTDIAVQLSETLEKIHLNKIIHRDLRPDNIFIEPESKRVYITNFSSAMQFFAHTCNIPASASTILAGSPGYMSPEQTGRIKISTDKRSDLYSLGVVFYELLTGSLPFQANNPAEWAYAHLTQKPASPVQVNPAIPAVISDIIIKLLNKNPDERYQSAYGLMCDLKECKRQLIETGRIEHMAIGKKDNTAHFRLTEKFYGRKKEIDILRASFSRVCKGSTETILISGEPGIGKTMLVNESLKPAISGKGLFIIGKVDQLRKNIPYAPYADAFGNLVRQLMTESSNKLSWWKNKILHSIGRNCAVITEIIPELEWIIGKQSPAETLPPQEAENRFLNIFKDFIKVFAWKDHPLVLFLDDLQWADHASVKLLDFLMQDASIRHLLIVGAFRENELNDDHPLFKIIKEHQEHKESQGDQNNRTQVLIQILLSPLKRIEAKNLVMDSLGIHSEYVAPLTQCLYRKSGGNPFSLRQMLMMIHDDGLLYFDVKQDCWQWNLEVIQKLQQGEDVLELILRKIQRLPEETQELVKLASCYGNRFELEALASFWNKSIEETADALMPSINEGLVISLEKEMVSGSSLKGTCYEFLHDRMQQAAYSLVTEEEKKKSML